MVLVCNHTEAAAQVLDALEGYSNPASQMRLVRMHGRGKIDRKTLMSSREWKDAVATVKSLGDTPNLEMDV